MHFGSDSFSNMSMPSPPSSRPDVSERTALIRQAFVLEWVTVGWMIIEAVVAIVAALTASSLSLLAFGIDSLIELMSACVLVWRLTVELKHGRNFSERAERTASWIGGGLLFALALYVAASVAFSFWRGRGQEFSLPGVALSIIAIPIMWWLSRRKFALAEQLGSRSLRTDAMESITCGYLSGMIVTGLIAQLILGAWWVDGVTSLAIVCFLIKEGYEAWQSESCSGDEA